MHSLRLGRDLILFTWHNDSRLRRQKPRIAGHALHSGNGRIACAWSFESGRSEDFNRIIYTRPDRGMVVALYEVWGSIGYHGRYSCSYGGGRLFVSIALELIHSRATLLRLNPSSSSRKTAPSSTSLRDLASLGHLSQFPYLGNP